MSDSLGKITSILIAAILFIGIPLTAMQERMKTAAQMYLLAEETEFVDSICNTGVLTWEMYEQFMWSINKLPELYNVEILQEQKELLVEGEEVTYVSRYYDTKEILEILKKNGKYYFYRNDYIRVCITKKEGGFQILGISDQTMQVFYGGTIRNEAM